MKTRLLAVAILAALVIRADAQTLQWTYAVEPSNSGATEAQTDPQIGADGVGGTSIILRYSNGTSSRFVWFNSRFAPGGGLIEFRRYKN